MTDPSPKPTSFQRLLAAASDHTADAGLFVLGLGTVAATAITAATGTPVEALGALLGGVGWAAFAKLMDRADDDTVTEETLREALRTELATLPDGWADELTALRTHLEGQQNFLADALAGVPHAVAAQLADELERQRLLTTNGVKYLRGEMVDVKRLVGEGQKDLDDRVRAGVRVMLDEVRRQGGMTRETVREEGAKTREAVEDLGAQIQQGFARLAPQPGLGKLSLPGRPTHFIGREDLLAQVTPLLHPSKVLTLWGPGGMGKTTLAAQALWEMHDAGDLLRRFPDGVLNYDFYGEPSPTGVYERIIYHFAAPPPEAKIEATREAARAALAGKRALLVLDGAENIPHLRDVLDARGLCGVLLTSRNSADVFETGLEVTALDESHGVALLQTWGGDYAADPDACRGIYTLVGELTLALELAGKYMHATHTPAADVYADLQTAPLDTLELGTPHRGAHRRDSVRVLLAKSVTALTDEVRNALSVMGLLANRPFPFALLAAALGLEPALTRKLVAELIAHGLATRENDTLRTRHALVHAYARKTLPAPDEAPARLANALARAASEANETGLPARYAPLRPHVAEAAVWAADRGLEDASTLWNEHGYHLNMVGDYAGARVAYERALAIIEQHLGTDHPNMATLYNNLGSVMQARGDYAEARAAFTQALAIVEQHLGKNHPNMAIMLNNLGTVMREQGDYAGARVAFERALAIDEVAFGQNNPKVAIRISNLGLVLYAQGNYVEAREAFKRALAIDEGTFDPDHPAIAIDVNNLGGVLFAQGDYAGARAAFERVLAIDEAAFGPDHPNLARIVSNLGLVLQNIGDFTGTQAAFERALAIDEATFGPDHPNVAIRVNNLGSVMRIQGDYARARAAYERALAIFERFLGPDHPNTKIVRGNLEALGPGV